MFPPGGAPGDISPSTSDGTAEELQPSALESSGIALAPPPQEKRSPDLSGDLLLSSLTAQFKQMANVFMLTDPFTPAEELSRAKASAKNVVALDKSLDFS